jgi:hypothetical protein
VPSWGRSLRGRRPAPSLSDWREGRSSSVAPAAAPCLALGREWLRSRSLRRRLPRQLEEVLPPALIAKAGHGLTSNSTAFCPSLPHEFGHGRGLLAAASALRSVLPLFGPPEQKSSSSPLLEQVTARRSSVFRCSAGPPLSSGAVRTCGGGNRSSVCNGTSNASVFVHYGFRGLNMYVISARSRVFFSFLSAKTRLLII